MKLRGDKEIIKKQLGITEKMEKVINIIFNLILINDKNKMDMALKIFKQNEKELFSILSIFCVGFEPMLKDMIKGYQEKLDDDNSNNTDNDYLNASNFNKDIFETIEIFKTLFLITKI
jgi:hypothetical protein